MINYKNYNKYESTPYTEEDLEFFRTQAKFEKKEFIECSYAKRKQCDSVYLTLYNNLLRQNAEVITMLEGENIDPKKLLKIIKKLTVHDIIIRGTKEQYSEIGRKSQCRKKN